MDEIFKAQETKLSKEYATALQNEASKKKEKN